MKKITLGLLSIFTASSLFAGTYSVDTSHSTAGFSVKHMMVSNVVGKIKDISGTYEYDEKANTLLSVQGELNVASIDTADEKRDAHLKADDILDVAKFPKISFKSTKVEKDVVYGDLTIKGITKNIKLNLIFLIINEFNPNISTLKIIMMLLSKKKELVFRQRWGMDLHNRH